MTTGVKSVLVVEDERPMAKALELKLAHEGFNPKSAFNGEEALELLRKEKFDLMLLDLVMPKVDGFKVLETMKAENIMIPTIILSNLSQQEDERRVRELGARDFFIKSEIPISEVIARIKKILG
jgi:DNA-binding response OmpR family regulator